ncbi:MAG: nitroreductase family protein [Anaerolineaceae bacterium]|nr:nitroreductase family protein [Anaerolineaceae bacterium]
MEFYDLIRKRKMVRAFRPDPIPDDSLARILDAAQRAPSAGHSQGQRFIVIQDETRKAKIAENCNERMYTAAGYAPFISGAPVLIIPCTNEQIYRRRYREKDKLLPDGSEFVWPAPYWYMDIGCSVMNILLAAVEEGLAAGFACFSDNPALRELLGIPEEVEPMGAIPIGYAAPDQTSPSQWREKSKDIIRFERW